MVAPRVYRTLLLLYPAAFREEYGEEMAFVFREQLQDAPRKHVVWLRVARDLLTIAPKLLQELDSTEGELKRELDPEKAKSMNIERIPMDKDTFERMHKEDRMAHDKLKEGIEGFSKSLEELEQLLAKRVSELRANEPELATR